MASSNTVARVCAVGMGALCASAVLAAIPARAADPETAVQEADAGTQELTRLQRLSQRLAQFETVVAAGASFEPKYDGSDQFTVSPVPYVSMTFFDRVTVDPTGVTAEVIERGPLKLLAKAGYDSGRSEDDADALDGLGDVDFGATLGGRVEAAFRAVTVYAEVEKTLGGSDGLTGVAGIEVAHAVRPWLQLGAGASVTFADDNEMDAYFGVDRGQARRSGYARFDPDAGLQRVDLKAVATVALSQHWFVRGEAGLGILTGDAADSPIVRDEIQPQVMLVVGYRF